MDIKFISNRYHVRKLLEKDVPDIYRLCVSVNSSTPIKNTPPLVYCY